MPPKADHRLAAASLRASGVIGGVGLAFLVGMFAAFAAGARSTGLALGFVNDVTGIVTLPLALPGVLALHRRIRATSGPGADALLLVGIGAGGAIVVLQVLLVTETLTFEQQVGPVSMAFLVLGAWFVAYGRIASKAGVFPDGARLGLAAALYAGYPLWAFRLARAVEAAAGSTPGRHDATGTAPAIA